MSEIRASVTTGGAGAAVRCAIVGLGRIGSLLEDDPLREKPCTHAGAIAANPDCELVGGCDCQPERRTRFSERWDCPAVYADIDRLLLETRPDILCIATHPDSHRRMVERAARHGVAVAVCEKPLAYSMRDARAIAALHCRRRVTVLTNHERRYSADYQNVRRLISQRRFGLLISIRGTLYFGRARRHDQVLLHDGTHMVDIINFLAAGTLRVRRSLGSMRARTSSAFLYGTIETLPVVIEVGAQRDHLVFELELSFESGRIRIGNGVYTFEQSTESPYYQGYRSLRAVELEPIGPTGYFSGMLTDAVACVTDRQRTPLSSAEDGLASMRVVRAIRSRI
ncbi:MAG: gfo/Idh/MocA family oxidoreductase [Spirochaetaceae bacterium]|nr:MAG: gfo/Idh/MocA family oxidoreductase [Spirochaetaceae bacterium]